MLKLEPFQSETSAPRSETSSARAACSTSFRSTLLAAIVASTVITCSAMFMALECYRQQLHDIAIDRITLSAKVQHLLVANLSQNVTSAAFSRALDETRSTIALRVLDELDDEVDTAWTFMRNQHLVFPDWTGRSRDDRSVLANFTYQQLRQHLKRTQNNPHHKMIKVSWSSGEEAACSVTKAEEDRYHHIFAYDMPGNSSSRTRWAVDWDTGIRIEPPDRTRVHDMGKHPAYLVQVAQAAQALASPGGAGSVASKWLWSPLFHSWVEESVLGVSLTAPISYCENYSCLEGVIEAFVSLEYISFYCDNAWRRLASTLGSSMYRSPIGAQNSSVFVVNHVSANKTQEGMLLAASHSMLTDRTFAEEYESGNIVRSTARAIIDRFDSWHADALRWTDQMFTFRPSASGNATEFDCADHDRHCFHLGTRSVRLDDDTRWLVVVVLPAGVFSLPAQLAEDHVHRQIAEIGGELETEMGEARAVGVGIFGGAVLLGVAVALFLSFLVSRRLTNLAFLIRRLGDLDFSPDSAEFALLRSGRRSKIVEVGNLQDSFVRLSRGIEAFAKFVPETVVQSIVRGEPMARHLHVSRRHVTIMFSDIRDFTAITESLPERVLVDLLTRYFSAMTKAVERYEGVVAEILGDGLLVYWNAPGSVEGHAEKACKAALAQQEALQELNEALEADGLPSLFVRIGVHSGAVFSGNIGSESKMKFGCIGDPVNTASRLEGLCKVYGVAVLCSQATAEALPKETTLLTRRLDMVRVKGKQKAMGVLEVICDSSDLPGGRDGEAAAAARQLAASYEEALDLFQQAKFEACAALLSALCEAQSQEEMSDHASAKLLQRALLAQGESNSFDIAAWNYISHITEK